MTPGTIGYYDGPTESSSLSCNDTLLVLSSRQSRYAMVQVLSGKLNGAILYLPYSFIKVKEE